MKSEDCQWNPTCRRCVDIKSIQVKSEKSHQSSPWLINGRKWNRTNPLQSIMFIASSPTAKTLSFRASSSCFFSSCHFNLSRKSSFQQQKTSFLETKSTSPWIANHFPMFWLSLLFQGVVFELLEVSLAPSAQEPWLGPQQTLFLLRSSAKQKKATLHWSDPCVSLEDG